MNNIILTATLIVAFFMCICSFILGYRVRQQIDKGIIPKVNLNPLKPLQDAMYEHEMRKEDKKINDELEDAMSATKESMLSAIRKEVR